MYLNVNEVMNEVVFERGTWLPRLNEVENEVDNKVNEVENMVYHVVYTPNVVDVVFYLSNDLVVIVTYKSHRTLSFRCRF